MDSLVDKILTCNMENLEEKLKEIPLDEQVGLCVIFNSIKYEFLVHIKSNNPDLLCLGPSGLKTMDEINEFKSRPVYHRHSWNFEESTIFYNDNTRYVWDGGIGAGWGIGSIDDYFLENIKNIILKITKFFKINNRNIIFYGSSMGGFTSIQLATMIKDSYAIAENPQIDCRKWMKRVYIKQNYYSKLYDDETLRQIEPYRYNVVEMIKKEDYIPNLTIISCVSYEDINYHLTPFIKELTNFPFKPEDLNKIKIVIEPSKIHQPSSQSQLHKIIKMIKSNKDEKYLEKDYSNEIQKAIPLIKKYKLFDKKYYKKSYPQIGQLDPLTHYLIEGWKEGCNPSPQFDNDFYLKTYDDVLEAKMNPLVHYVNYGMNENRQINKVNPDKINSSFISRFKQTKLNK